MKFLEKIFSVKNEKHHKVICFLGLKIKFINNRKYIKNLEKRISHLETLNSSNFLSNLMFSICVQYGITEEFINFIKLLSQSPYLFKTQPHVFWLQIISSLLEYGAKEDACRVLKDYVYHYGVQDISHYLQVAHLAVENNIIHEEIQKADFVYKNFNNKNYIEKFKQYLRGKSIAVVGGSGCELGKNKGKEIDSHDIVIRFNNYSEEQKYFCDYGQKTTIWVRQSSRFTRHKSDISEYDYVIWGDNKNTLNIIPEHLNIMYDYFSKTPEKFVNIENKYYYDLKKSANLINPTTGAVTIYMLNSILGSLDNVDIYGFAFLNENIKDLSHYWENTCIISPEHDFDREISFMHKFCIANKHINSSTYINGEGGSS